MDLDQFFSSQAFAVIGASENREKYGNIIYRYLRDKDFVVYPVNPRHDEVEGERCYGSVSELPAIVKSVVSVVPPKITEQLVVECKAKGITAVWMQPGAESLEAITYAEHNGMTVIYDACIMVMLAPVHSSDDLAEWLIRARAVYG